MMREEKEITVNSGEYSQNFIISKFPAIVGREIVAGYPLTALPKIGEYKANEEIMLKLMAFVQVKKDDGTFTLLTTRGLIDGNILSWEILAKVEMEMINYNCSFFQDGAISNFLKSSRQKLPQFLSKILTDSLERLSSKKKLPSES